MTLGDAFRIFYRLLALELDVRPAPRGAAELVVENAGGLPDEDVIALAQAVALQASDGLGPVHLVRLRAGEPWPAADGQAQVIDFRSVAEVPTLDIGVLLRRDLVLLRSGRQARFGGVAVKFDPGHRLTFEAASKALSELARLADYRGAGVEMAARYLSRGLRAVAVEFGLVDGSPEVRREDQQVRFIEAISSQWRYHGEGVHAGAVLDWLRQFEDDQKDGAIAVLAHLHASGYYSTSEIANTLSALLAQHASGALLVAVQKHGKSESKLLYEMRKQAPPIDEAVKGTSGHLVCVDDVIGSGMTIAEALFDDLDGLPETAVARWLTMSDRRITVLAAIASAEGIAKIENHPRSLGRVRVFAGKVFDDTGVFSDRLQVFPTAEIAASFRGTCRRIGGKLDAQSPLGWGDCAWAIVAEYNVPDCTLPIIWKGDPNLPWKALFPRR